MSLKLNPGVMLQSPHIYLQAAGSEGADSTKGIHLRWSLKRALGSHLPKANLAMPLVNFNKPDDFVMIHRATYEPRVSVIGFSKPSLIHPFQWFFVNSGEAYYLNFIDRSRYNQVRASVDPSVDLQAFLLAYGNGVLELEHKTKLAFAVQLSFKAFEPRGTVELELRSVEENSLIAPRCVTLRQVYDAHELGQKKLLSENVRSIRFRATNALLTRAVFEFYDDYLAKSIAAQEWSVVGKYALTIDDNEAFHRLEPLPGVVHGQWLRFNDQAFVNISNYQAKWNSVLPLQNRIAQTVQRYIDLSNDPANPNGQETILYFDPEAERPPDQQPEAGFDPSDSTFPLSNLFVLQTAAMDFHIARMLGLGTLDLDSQVMAGHYVYVAEYFTIADLQDGQGKRDAQHLFMSLPTALTDQRLSLPIDLLLPVPGIVLGADTEAPTTLTDADGYSHDGRTRYLSLYNEPLPAEPENAPFFHSNLLIVSAERTLPVYAGIEYRKSGDANWKKPELTFDATWLNVDSTVGDEFKQETRPVVIPSPIYPLYLHRERHSGIREFSAYGINWFSRATSSQIVWSVETEINPRNQLLPPTNLNAVLVVAEQPLLLTSAAEQTELAALTSADKTFIRLSWEYNHGQELISYHREINGDQLPDYTELPDNQEPFADEFEIYFRNSVPQSVGGKIINVTDASDPVMAVVTTGEYVFQSMGTDPVTGLPVESLVPVLPVALESNFIGSLLVVDGRSFPIHSIDNSGEFPKFIVFKVDAEGNAASSGNSISPSELIAPAIDGLFTAVENMAVAFNWGAGNPQSLLVNVEPKIVHRETVRVQQPDGTLDTYVHKFRGIYREALIEPVLENQDGDSAGPPIHLGLYKLTFAGFTLPQHSQAGAVGHRVEFFGGIVRIHTTGGPEGQRKELAVVRAENIGTSNPLTLYVADKSFVFGDPSYDAIPLGTQSVNYYPAYRAYLFADPPHNLTEANILPQDDDQLRYTVLGLRSHNLTRSYFSPVSVPALMFARAITEPRQPRSPVGGQYATRPDFYGKSTFTFTTVFEHAPYAVQYLRASDIQILTALYTSDNGDQSTWTVKRIQEEILVADEWFNDRWRNLLGFNYVYPDNPANDGRFEELPIGGMFMPLPNNPQFISAMNEFVDDHNTAFGTTLPHLINISSLHQVVIPGTAGNAELQVKDFVRETVQNCFLPLTELPVIYQYIHGPSYEPRPGKQVVRDRNGVLLRPDHPDFEIAPMARRIGPSSATVPPKLLNETQFTDFNLDGAANAHYFYAVREFDFKMKTGPFSSILGPVHLVNTSPPRPPEVVKVIPILEQRELGIAPAIEIRINSYPISQKIQSAQVYRATAGINARTVRTMVKIADVDLVQTDVSTDTQWILRDDFSDLGFVPFGDPLFYLVTVAREVEYFDRNGNLISNLVPSDPSKLVLTNIVESYHPDAPRLEYYSTPLNSAGELQQVTLVWEKTVHNGKHHLYYRNTEGNWIRIATKPAESNRVVVNLASLASFGSGSLQVQDPNGNPIYHHFKVVSENFAGMLSRTDKILTIHQPAQWHDISTL